MSSEHEMEVNKLIGKYLSDKNVFIEKIKTIKDPDFSARLSLLKFTIYENRDDELRNLEKVKRLLKNASKENNFKAYRMAALIIVLNMIETIEVNEDGEENNTEEISSE